MSKLTANQGLKVYQLFCLANLGHVRIQTLNDIMKWEKWIRLYRTTSECTPQ